MFNFRKSKSVTVIFLLCLFIGIVFVIAWVVQRGYQTFFPDSLTMTLNTAFSFILLSIALLTTQYQFLQNKTLFIGLLILLTLFNALSLSQHIFYFNAGIDRLLVEDKLAILHKDPFPGRMSVSVTLCFILLGLGSLGFTVRNYYVNTVSQYFFHLVTAISAVALMGYIYGASLLYNLSYVNSIASSSATLFFLLSLGAAYLHPALGITKLFTGTLVGNDIARRLFIPIVIAIVLLGEIRVKTWPYHFFSFETGASLVALTFIFVCLFIMWNTLNKLNNIDLKRRKAEENVQIMVEKLEEMVEERSAQLLNILEKNKQSELKFRTLSEKSMVGVYIAQKEKFVYVNPRFAEIFGYEQDELIDTSQSTIEMIINDKDREIVRNNVKARFAGEIDYLHYEVKGKKKDGTPNYIEFYGNSVIIDGEPSIIGTMLDVTERRKAEGILKRSEANLKTIMDTTDTAYALLDKKLNVMAFNQMAVKFVNSQFNHTPVKGDQLSDYFPSERFPQFIKYAEEVLQGRNISYEINYPQLDGSVFWYYVRLFQITNDKNEIFGMMLALSDITERKNAEGSLRTAYEEIQAHINRIKEMAWKQSHLLRSPLANLMGLAAMLKADPSDSEVHQFINIELERMDKVIIEMAEEASKHDQ
jgi:PAS domain S-box-containing protein